MSLTNNDKLQMTDAKANSKSNNEQLVFAELKKMGFSYACIGTHRLHDSIVCALEIPLEKFSSVSTFCEEIANIVSAKCGISRYQYINSSAIAIEAAFASGNIDYILDVVGEFYDRDKMTTKRKHFIMAVRERILPYGREERENKEEKLRSTIISTAEKIRDVRTLENLCGIMLLIGSGVNA